MTRRLGGPNKNLAAIASLSLAATLACVGAMTGCGSSSSQTQPGDSGPGNNFDSGMEDSPFTNTPETGVTTPPVDAAPPLPVCGTPTISPNGGAVTIGSTFTITGATGFPSTGNIFFTTDGTAPTHTSQLYSGAIQLSQNETVHAIAYASGTCTDSAFATAMFTVSLGDGGITPPIFNPPSTTENNNFLVSLSDGASGVTICFTTDGSTTPTCTVTGTSATCGAGSTTYNAGAGLNAAGSVSITPAITNATTGVVSIQAVACVVGAATTAVAKQQYTLQVANPTMQGPAAGNLPYIAAGYAPTAGSVTTGASIRYTTDGSTVTCNTGTLLQTALGVAQNPGNPPLNQNTTFSVIGCESGYAPSTAEPFAYTITLNPPALVTAAGTYDGTFSAGFTTSATSNSGVGGLYYCSSTTVSEPACGTTAGACATGTAGAAAVTTTGTTVAAVACAPNFNGSAATTATYTLQLSPPAISPPGCVLAGGGTGDCRTSAGASTPALSYTVPAGGITPNIEQSPGAAVNVPPGGNSGAYAFACAIKGGAAPSCGAASCTSGTSVGPIGAQSFTTSPGVPLSNAALTIAAGDSWTVVACPGSNTAFAPSAPTTVNFSLPGQALAPAITPGTGTANNTLTATVTNQDPVSTVICTSTSATAPTCNGGGTACASGAGHTVTPFGKATVTALSLTSGGSGYSTPPTVTIAPPGSGTQAIATASLGFSVASVNVVTGGSGCDANTVAVTIAGGATATATVSGPSNSVSAITVTGGGSGYAAGSPPAVTFANCAVPPTATAVLSTTGSVAALTIANHGTGYSTVPAVTIAGNATATAILDDSFTVAGLSTNTETLTAVTCGGQTSPPEAARYSFQLATPDFSQGIPVGNLDSGGAITYGSSVTISTATTAVSLPSRFICATNNGSAPSCTCTPGTGIYNSVAGPWPVPPITGATTLMAIACDSQAAPNTWIASGIASAPITVTLPTPVLANPGGTYESSPVVTVSNTATFPAGTVYCYTTTAGATPQCNTGTTPDCAGGSTTYAGGITVNTTGTVINLVACSSTLTSPTTGGNTYTLNVTPVVVTNQNSALACGANNIIVGLDCSVGGGVCSSATLAAGGPTPGATFCYSTTTTVAGCGGGAGITCVPPGSGTVTLTENGTISAASCLVSGTQSFNTTTSSPTVTFTPFTFTPLVDGSLADWLAGTAAAPPADLTLTATAGVGYFGYDPSNYYFAYNDVTPAATTFVTIYVGNAGSGTGGTTQLLAPDTCTTSAAVLPTGINAEYAFTVETDNDAVTAYTWSVANAAWTPAGYAVTAKSAGANIEIGVSRASLGGITQPNVLGALVTHAGQTNCAAADPAGATVTWPYTAALYDDYAQANTASCQAPNANIK